MDDLPDVTTELKLSVDMLEDMLPLSTYTLVYSTNGLICFIISSNSCIISAIHLRLDWLQSCFVSPSAESNVYKLSITCLFGCSGETKW
jgi:hypothetical protein